MPRSALWLAAALTALLAPALPAQAGERPEARTLTVTGSGEVRAAPDRALVSLGVEARAATLEGARTGAARVVALVLKVTRDLGVADADVRSTRITVQTDYEWSDPKKSRTLVGYVVRRQVLVDLRNLDRLGDLLEQGIGAGANLVGEPQLDSSRRAALGREAMARAVADARANALALAGGLDASVGPPRSVSEGATSPAPMARQMMLSARAGAAPAPATYEPGELTFAASVTVTFDLVPLAAPR